TERPAPLAAPPQMGGRRNIGCGWWPIGSDADRDCAAGWGSPLLTTASGTPPNCELRDRGLQRALNVDSGRPWRKNALTVYMTTIALSSYGARHNQRRKGITFSLSRNVRIPSSATVRSNSAKASSSLANRSSHTMDVLRASHVGEHEARAALAKCLTAAVRRWPKWLDLDLQPSQRMRTHD